MFEAVPGDEFRNSRPPIVEPLFVWPRVLPSVL